ncbi:MAG: hypothetical protein FJ006_01875 [Chloroflexi bacterium]|nr:hypothetical protein [Chloroflexota bacterium]
MDIAWFRDLVIVISGLVVTCVVVFIAILAYLLYNRARSVLNSVEAIATTVREITSVVKDEVVNPIVQFVALIRGICQGVDIFSRFFKKQEGGRDG